ncbi:MAG TPA: ABC transporter ATP-binding protein, partial [Herpetosiphonaceae bacterium]
RVLWVRPPAAAEPEAPTPIVFGPPREVLAAMDDPPPLAAAARVLGWQPPPLTIKEGRKLRDQGSGVRNQGSGGMGMSGAWSAGGQSSADPRSPIPDPCPEGARPIVLEARKLRAAYDGVPALHNVDFTLRAGEIAAVMGRNGSGKTTLLRHLVGLQRPAGGSVLLRGADIGGRPVESLAREIGYVPQNPNDLLYHDTLAEELRFTLRSHGLPASEERIDATLAALGIAHLAGQYPRDLSGGEAQRAALAAILVAEPPVLLLDEPTRGLDYAAKAALAGLLKAQAAAGRAIALVSHDVEFVALCADSALLLGEGEVVVSGPTSEVLGDSLLFSTQIGKLFPGSGWLTVADLERALAAR